MEEINKQVIYEVITLLQAYHVELSSGENSKYSIYHNNRASLYKHLNSEYIDILKYKGTNENEFIMYVSTVEINEEQIEQLKRVREDPAFISLFGTLALQNKIMIEKAINEKIVFEKEDGVNKTQDELIKELDDYKIKLDEALENRKILKSNHDKYMINLDYIYKYFIGLATHKIEKDKRISDEEINNRK